MFYLLTQIYQRLLNELKLYNWILTEVTMMPFCFHRLWDLERDDNYVLCLDESLGFEKGEMISCVSYCSGKGNYKMLVF